MDVVSLYNKLISRGVRLTLLDNCQLKYFAPVGSMDDHLRSEMKSKRDELVDFVLDVEEQAARILEIYDKDAAIPQAEIDAARGEALRLIVESRKPVNSDEWLRSYVKNHPYFVAARELGREFEIVSIRRVA